MGGRPSVQPTLSHRPSTSSVRSYRRPCDIETGCGTARYRIRTRLLVTLLIRFVHIPRLCLQLRKLSLALDGEMNPWARRRDIQRALSYKLSYNESVADTITFRPDEDASKALAVLTKDGTPVSTAVRAALIDAARRKATAAIRAEAERLADDEDDRAEAMQVLRDMETLRAW